MKVKPTARARRDALLRRLASSYRRVGRPRVIGLGKFSSGVPDLGSNEKHLKGFGS
jgi:hypothetical protein